MNNNKTKKIVTFLLQLCTHCVKIKPKQSRSKTN